MKQTLLAVICFLLFVLLVGCAADSGILPEGTVPIYSPSDWARNDETDELLTVRAVALEGDDPIAFCIAQLFRPTDVGLLSPFPAGTHVLSHTLHEGTLTLNLSAEYTQLSGFDLTMAEACLALTLCTLPDISEIQVLVAGTPYPEKSRYKSDDFSKDELVLKPVEQPLTLYFVDPNTQTLASEVHLVIIRENEPAERYVLEQLWGGPKTSEFASALPRAGLLLGVSTEDDICVVNLSAAFYDTTPPFTHALAIQAITRSLTSLPGIDAVQFMREGQIAGSYGDVPLDQPVN